MREKGRTMPIGNIAEDGDRTSAGAVSPEPRRPYVAPFLRHLDVSDSGATKTSDSVELSVFLGPS